MVTKYSTGDKVLVPATIRSAETRDGNISYTVETDWMIPEDRIKEDNSSFAYEALAEVLMPEKYGYRP